MRFRAREQCAHVRSVFAGECASRQYLALLERQAAYAAFDPWNRVGCDRQFVDPESDQQWHRIGLRREPATDRQAARCGAGRFGDARDQAQYRGMQAIGLQHLLAADAIRLRGEINSGLELSRREWDTIDIPAPRRALVEKSCVQLLAALEEIERACGPAKLDLS